MSTTETPSTEQPAAPPAPRPPIPVAPASEPNSVWGAPPAMSTAETLEGPAPARRWLPSVIRTKVAAGLAAAALVVGGTAGVAIGHSTGSGATSPAGRTGVPGNGTGQGGPGGAGGFGGPQGGQSGTGQSGTAQSGTQPGSGAAPGSAAAGSSQGGSGT